jgi:proteasome lid subunit RPN8/RPN11
MPDSIHAAGQPGATARTGRRLGALRDGTYTAVFRAAALEEILDYGESDLTRELGGFLLGGTWDAAKPVVEVRAFLPAGGTLARAASLTFTHETWAQLNRQVAERYPQESVVGWHHTHPGLGIFLSQYDLFIHRNFFRDPWQLAMVVDPQQQELGVFQWQGNQVVDCGFVCLNDPEAAPAE